jgi:hypothetical protein
VNNIIYVEVGHFGRAQQAYHLEHQTFASSMSVLEVTMGPLGQEREMALNYQYEIVTTAAATYLQVFPRHTDFSYERRSFLGLVHWHQKVDMPLFTYVGGISIVGNLAAGSTDPEVAQISCKATEPGRLEPSNPIFQAGELICPARTQAHRRS